MIQGFFNGSTTAGASTAFNNDGSFILSTPYPFYFMGETFNSDGGTVDVQAGTLHLDGGGTVTSSTFTVGSGAVLGLGGTFSFDSASSIQGAGTVSFELDVDNEQNAILTINGTYDVTGVTVASSGTTVEIDGPVDSIGASLTATDGTLNFNSAFIGTAGTIPTVDASFGTLNLGANDVTATTVTVTGKLSGTGTITVSGLLTLGNGTLSGAGTIDADGGISINDAAGVNNSDLILDGTTLNNAAGETAKAALGPGTLSFDRDQLPDLSPDHLLDFALGGVDARDVHLQAVGHSGA